MGIGRLMAWTDTGRSRSSKRDSARSRVGPSSSTSESRSKSSRTTAVTARTVGSGHGEGICGCTKTPHIAVALRAEVVCTTPAGTQSASVGGSTQVRSPTATKMLRDAVHTT